MGAITHAVITSIKQLEQEGRSIEQICQFTGRSKDVVTTILRGRHALQCTARPITKKALLLKTRTAIEAIVGERTGRNIGRGESFLPTPQQIEAACKAIREAWSEAERYNRCEVIPAAVRRPVAPASHAIDYE